MVPPPVTLSSLSDQIKEIDKRINTLSENITGNVTIANIDRKEYREGISLALSEGRTYRKEILSEITDLRKDLHVHKEKTNTRDTLSEIEIATIKGRMHAGLQKTAETGKKYSWMVTVFLVVEYVIRHLDALRALWN